MTPERAREIAEWLRIHAAECLTVGQQILAIQSDILAACAEERKAALTEAAELPGNPHSINRDAILALRDRA